MGTHDRTQLKSFFFFSKVKMMFGIFFFVAVLTMASATKKGDDTLLSVLSKEREEMKAMFRHENKELRLENMKLQQKDDKVRIRDEQLQEQIIKLRDEKLQDENAQLKKEIEKLRHVNRRQRDQIDSFGKKESIRQEDIALETKKRESRTSNSSPREAIAEVAFTNGSAHATSASGSSYLPAKAFIVGGINYWYSSFDAKYTGVFPKMIWYDFSIGNGFVPARITFQSCQSSSDCPQYTPSIWEFVGSNDDVCSKSGEWTILCRDYSDVQPRSIYAIKRCDVEGRAEKKFRCLGINILSTHHANSALSNIRMWRKA